MVLWFYGSMVLWFYGSMVLWFYGSMVLALLAGLNQRQALLDKRTTKKLTLLVLVRFHHQ